MSPKQLHTFLIVLRCLHILRFHIEQNFNRKSLSEFEFTHGEQIRYIILKNYLTVYAGLCYCSILVRDKQAKK